MLLVLLVVLLLFGGEKMPQLAKGLGKTIREFKKAASDVEQEIKRAIDEVPDAPDLKTMVKDALDPAPAPKKQSVALPSPPPAPPAPPSDGPRLDPPPPPPAT